MNQRPQKESFSDYMFGDKVHSDIETDQEIKSLKRKLELLHSEPQNVQYIRTQNINEYRSPSSNGLLPTPPIEYLLHSTCQSTPSQPKENQKKPKVDNFGMQTGGDCNYPSSIEGIPPPPHPSTFNPAFVYTISSKGTMVPITIDLYNEIKEENTKLKDENTKLQSDYNKLLESSRKLNARSQLLETNNKILREKSQNLEDKHNKEIDDYKQKNTKLNQTMNNLISKNKELENTIQAWNVNNNCMTNMMNMFMMSTSMNQVNPMGMMNMMNPMGMMNQMNPMGMNMNPVNPVGIMNMNAMNPMGMNSMSMNPVNTNPPAMNTNKNIVKNTIPSPNSNPGVNQFVSTTPKQVPSLVPSPISNPGVNQFVSTTPKQMPSLVPSTTPSPVPSTLCKPDVNTVGTLQAAPQETPRTDEEPEEDESSDIPFHKLYIKNLTRYTNESDLESIFAPYGASQYLVGKGKLRCQAFITFPSVDFATKALKEHNNKDCKGKPMIIAFARSKETAAKIKQQEKERERQLEIEKEAIKMQTFIKSLKSPEIIEALKKLQATTGQSPLETSSPTETWSVTATATSVAPVVAREEPEEITVKKEPEPVQVKKEKE